MKTLPFFFLFLLSTAQVSGSEGAHSNAYLKGHDLAVGTCSWYSSKDACKYNPSKGCPTASGISIYDLERQKKDFAASWFYPMGSVVKVTNPDNGRSVKVRILDRGPAKRLGRIIDLSKNSFRKIADLKDGVIPVHVEVI